MELLINWLASTPSFAEPYMLAALGLMISERAGVLSLGAEGFMLVGALGARLRLPCLRAVAAPAAMLVALIVTAIASILFAIFATFLRINQVIAGLTTVFFFQGMTDMAGTLGDWNNHAIAGLDRLPLGPLARLPVLGPIFFNQDFVIYLTVAIVAAIHFFMSRSMFGLRLRAVGDSPETADGAGVSVVGAIVSAPSWPAPRSSDWRVPLQPWPTSRYGHPV